MRIPNPSHQLIVFYLYILCCLSSCGVQKDNQAISAENYQLDSVKENNSVSHTQYLNLLDIVERLRVYTEEEANKPVAIFEGDTEECINLKRQHQNNKVEFTDELYNLVDSLITGKQDFDHYFYNLLEKRLVYLCIRHRALGYQLSPENKTGMLIPPTSKLLFDWLAQSPGFSQDITEQEDHRIDSVTRFEMLNLLIKESFAHCNVDHLKKATIDVLRACVQLHPILSGERLDLGHPDEACSYYGILEPIFISKNPLHNKLKSLLKLKDEIKKQIRTNFPTKKNDNLFLARMFIEVIENLKEKKGIIATFPDMEPGETPLNERFPGIETDLLEIKRNMDIGFMEGHLLHKKVFIPFMGLGTKDLDNPSRTPVICVTATDYQLSRWPYPLPEPAFLKTTSLSKTRPSSNKQQSAKQKKNRAGERILQHSNSTTYGLTDNKKTDNLAPEVSTEVTAIKSNMVEVNIQPLQQQGTALCTFNHKTSVAAVLTDFTKEEIAPREKEKETEKEKEKEKEKETEKEMTPLFPYQSQEEGIVIYQQTSSNLAENEKEPYVEEEKRKAWSFKNNWELPRGLRMFHNQMFSNIYLPHHARSNQNQAIVDRLFNLQQRCTVTFKEFKTLWESEEGKIIGNKGGSHKELIGPKGDKLFGIFAHGNQTYGENYVKYLQTAVLYIGLRPSDLLNIVDK